ncbi:MAG TPA: YHS domain-containing protein [Candidatus Paceibacterota bacterium]
MAIGNNKDIKVKDLVCGMLVDLGKTQFASERGKEKHYFCSKSCKDNFDKSPELYTSGTKQLKV